MTIIGIVRHGITDWNQQGRAQGQHDVPLNAEGLLQANLLGRRLATEDWDAIYTSDLSRAIVTAERIATAMSQPIAVMHDSRLREKTHGRLDGTTVPERVAFWGEGWRDLDHDEESNADLLLRILDFLQEITAHYPDGRILIVSHGAWIRTLLAELFKEKEITFLNNTCFTIIEKRMPQIEKLRVSQATEQGWECLLFNCIEHLQLKE